VETQTTTEKPVTTAVADTGQPLVTWTDVYTAEQLGRFVGELRRARGLTQSELARELGVTRQYISELERGVPSLYTDRLFSLLRLLGGSLRGQFSS